MAGWGPSGTGYRPGFGWYFGGDAAINTLAMDATGQWEDVAEALRFLARYQREDGKIPHEISQSAGRIPWFDEYPYAYYHADTTPYWMLALWQYWRASGDEDLLRELWPAFERAYRWCLSVETDGDGIIENTTGGLGAIEVGGVGRGPPPGYLPGGGLDQGDPGDGGDGPGPGKDISGLRGRDSSSPGTTRTE